jgi:hypothetical protein
MSTDFDPDGYGQLLELALESALQAEGLLIGFQEFPDHESLLKPGQDLQRALDALAEAIEGLETPAVDDAPPAVRLVDNTRREVRP